LKIKNKNEMLCPDPGFLFSLFKREGIWERKDMEGRSDNSLAGQRA